MRKLCVSIIVWVLVLCNSICIYADENNGYVSVNTNFVNSGFISLKYDFSKKDKRVKLMVKKDDNKYIYDIKKDGIYENFPLQMGNGKYEISVLENTYGNKYRHIYDKAINAKIIENNSIYLQSIQIINWNDSMKPIKLAKELTKNVDDDAKKIDIIYNYIVNNLQYDYKKLDKLPSDYVPDINGIFKNKKGICYDYSALFAAMLRSIGVPTKLVKGYTDNINGYHAWNEVYMKNNKKWITIDTTYDSEMKKNNGKYKMEKNNKIYYKLKEY